VGKEQAEAWIKEIETEDERKQGAEKRRGIGAAQRRVYRGKEMSRREERKGKK